MARKNTSCSKSTPEQGSLARRRAQIGVFGAETYSCTLSTENVEMGPYPPRVSPAQSTGISIIETVAPSPRGVAVT